MAGIILALWINSKIVKGKKFWRTMFVFSVAVPQFVSLLVMKTMLQPEGALNVLLRNMGLIEGSLPFLTNAAWARTVVIIVNLWLGLSKMLEREFITEYFTQFAAGCVLVSIPIAILLICLQKYYVEGIASGASKG